MTGGEMNASAVTSIGTGKAAATHTASVMSDAGAAPAGEATVAAEAAAEAGVAAEERAETGSTEEAEVRKFPSTPPPTTINNSTGDQIQERKSSCQLSISDSEVLLETSWE